MQARLERLYERVQMTLKYERYQDMLRNIHDLILERPNLTSEEKNMLKLALEKATAPARSVLQQIKESGKQQNNVQKKYTLTEKEVNLQRKVSIMCNATIDLINQELIPNSAGAQMHSFYWNIKGDCYKYLVATVFQSGEEKNLIQSSQACYQKSQEILASGLKETDSQQSETVVDATTQNLQMDSKSFLWRLEENAKIFVAKIEAGRRLNQQWQQIRNLS